MNNPANFGLEMIVDHLGVLYDEQIPFAGKEMSRADFYNLAGIVAVEYSIDYNNIHCNTTNCEMPQVCYKPRFNFRYS